MLITLPSGLAGEVRGLTGKEAHALADPQLARTGGNVEAMLKNCFLEITAPGPYPWGVGARPDWKKVLLGDRFAALLDIRTISFGSDYEFSLQCGSRTCRERYEWELALKDLPRKTLPEESIELFKSGNRFAAELADGRAVTFRLAIGEDEHVIANQRRKNRGHWSAIDAVSVQIVSIEGEGRNVVQASAIRALLEALPWGQINILQNDMQAVDCGVETGIETECPFCGWVQDVQLPFGETFFLPKPKRKKEETMTNGMMTTKAKANGEASAVASTPALSSTGTDSPQ